MLPEQAVNCRGNRDPFRIVAGQGAITRRMISAKPLPRQALDDGKAILECFEPREFFWKFVLGQGHIDHRAQPPRRIAQFASVIRTDVVVLQSVWNEVIFVDPRGFHHEDESPRQCPLLPGRLGMQGAEKGHHRQAGPTLEKLTTFLNHFSARPSVIKSIIPQRR